MKDKITILSYDPSGSYAEGKGTTGYSIWTMNILSNAYRLEETGNIKASDFPDQYQYFHEHIRLINRVKPDVLVMEDFTLYANKAKQQIGSTMETPQLIGLLKYYCIEHNIDLVMQRAVDVKNRWNDKILVYKGIIRTTPGGYKIGTNGKNISRHAKDSIRHAMHYITKRIKENTR